MIKGLQLQIFQPAGTFHPFSNPKTSCTVFSGRDMVVLGTLEWIAFFESMGVICWLGLFIPPVIERLIHFFYSCLVGWTYIRRKPISIFINYSNYTRSVWASTFTIKFVSILSGKIAATGSRVVHYHTTPPWVRPILLDGWSFFNNIPLDSPNQN